MPVLQAGKGSSSILFHNLDNLRNELPPPEDNALPVLWLRAGAGRNSRCNPSLVSRRTQHQPAETVSRTKKVRAL